MTAAPRDADGNEDGHYLLLTSGAGEAHTQLKSPWFREAGENCHIEMDVNFFDPDRAHIVVVINKESSSDSPVYVASDPVSTDKSWNKFTEKIGKIRERFQLIIEVKVQGGTRPNHVGIDNIQLVDCPRETMPVPQPCDGRHFQCYNNKCIAMDQVCDLHKDCLRGEDELQYCDQTPEGTPCDFESGQCGWENGQAHLEWNYYSGLQAAEMTAPAADHTYGNASGHYMFLDVKAGNFSSYGLLVSPVFPPMPKYNSDRNSPYYGSCKCRFFIHMYGAHVGEASLHIVDANGKSSVWREFGPQANAWERVVATLPIRYNASYQLEFHGVRSFGNQGTIGIDDISLSLECFGLGVPEEFRQGYNVDLKRPETWVISKPSVPEPNANVLTFGTCRTTGHLGPQQRTCDLAYRNSSVQVQVLDYRHYKGVQRWRVPATGVYSLVASGASGGKGFESFSQVSKASTAVSVVHLNKGEEIFMVVGQEGTTACHKDATGTTRESCDYGVPRTIASLSRLHRVTGLWRSRRHRASRDTSSELLKRLRKIQFEGGGGGGGGGTFVFQVKDQLQVPLVVAAGGGGLSNNKNDLASPHGRGENHTVGHGNGRASEPYGADLACSRSGCVSVGLV
ncbi:ALK tyrosine kinase receptor-like [Pollicipes pollicipes]|uniref:ALK tyrosine kinase receptor-like n=1 Tax=Pollicipes pollicipes TaxID=41117 RepID=UPI001884FD1B|nr:ALK tyrosine kinase receptor-like [Pollicipes pollicipes]